MVLECEHFLGTWMEHGFKVWANSPPKKENFSQIHSRKTIISQFFCWQKQQNLSEKITLDVVCKSVFFALKILVLHK